MEENGRLIGHYTIIVDARSHRSDPAPLAQLSVWRFGAVCEVDNGGYVLIV